MCVVHIWSDKNPQGVIYCSCSELSNGWTLVIGVFEILKTQGNVIIITKAKPR